MTLNKDTFCCYLYYIILIIYAKLYIKCQFPKPQIIKYSFTPFFSCSQNQALTQQYFVIKQKTFFKRIPYLTEG